MEVAELKAALLQEFCQGVPEGTRVVGKEIGEGVVMREASDPGQLRMTTAAALVNEFLSCLSGGDDHILRQEEVLRIQQCADQHFELQQTATIFLHTRELIEKDRRAVRALLDRVHSSVSE